MRLLILTSNPNRASFHQRIDAYLPVMREAGIEPVVMPIPSRFLERSRLFASACQYDGVFLHKKGLNPLDARLLRKSARQIIYNYDDAVWLSAENPDARSRLHFNRWRRSVGIANMVIVGSSYLADAARPYNQNIHILPLGLKLSDYKSDIPKPSDGRIRLVWIGSASTLGYLRKIRPELEKIGKKYRNVILRQICDDFLDLDNMPVEKLKWQVDKRGEYLGTCDIGLAPLSDDPFTRGKCSFKVLEYSASGIPVVASPIGTNPDHVKEGQTGFLANTDDEWFEKISLLIDDEQLRTRMGQNGREYARQFDVSIIGQKLCRLITQLDS